MFFGHHNPTELNPTPAKTNFLDWPNPHATVSFDMLEVCVYAALFHEHPCLGYLLLMVRHAYCLAYHARHHTAKHAVSTTVGTPFAATTISQPDLNAFPVSRRPYFPRRSATRRYRRTRSDAPHYHANPSAGTGSIIGSTGA